MTPRSIAAYTATSAISGVLGWGLLMVAFEAAFWASAWMRRKRARDG